MTRRAEATALRLVSACVLASVLWVSWFAVPASAIEYVDGISDQGMPLWDKSFGGYFTDNL